MNYFLGGPVVAQVNDLGAGRLQEPPEDVYGRIMPVKKGRGGHYPELSA
jgi:hypothetical protein